MFCSKQPMILYERLQVSQDSTPEQIEKSYRTLAYMYMKQDDRAGMITLNDSYNILRDPYKRSFYDRYGDQYIQSLVSPSDSLFITRVLVPVNISCLLIYAYLNTVNFFFLGLICKIFKQAIFRYMLFVLSPILLAIVSVRVSKHVDLGDRNMMKFNLCALITMLNSVSIAILTLELGILCLAAAEAVANVCLLVYRRRDSELSGSLQRFMLIKAVLMLLYYLDLSQAHYFIPFLICLGTSVFDIQVGIALSLLILPMCLSMFLDETTSYVILPNVIHAAHGAFGCLALLSLSSVTYRLLVKANNKIHLCRLAINEPAGIRACI